jgi:hypothetical protein
MIREIFAGFLNGINVIEGDRWYFRFHSKEVVRFWGPWMRRYETYRAHDPPADAKRFGAVDGRLTEIWFNNMDDFTEADTYRRPYTMPSWRPGAAALTIVPAMPTEDFLGKEPTPEEKTILRWLCVFKYPDSVSLEDGERWYLRVHSQEVKQQPGLLRYVSHRSIVVEKHEKHGPFPTPWQRVSELWYEDFATWRKAVIDSPPRYTVPPWGGTYPFVDMVSIFVGYKPDVDFLKDNPLIP